MKKSAGILIILVSVTLAAVTGAVAQPPGQTNNAKEDKKEDKKEKKNVPVPEPVTLLLIGAGAGIVGIRRWRSRASSRG